MSEHFAVHQLSEILKLSAPLLMLDSAQLTDGENAATAVKMVSMGEHYFAGHFPGQPMMPGVLQIAAMAQLSRLLFLRSIPRMGGTRIVLAGLKRIRFRKPVVPGACLTVKSDIVSRNDDGVVEFRVSCATPADGTVCSGTILLRVEPDGEELSGMAVQSGIPDVSACGWRGTDYLMSILPHRPPFLLLDGIYDGMPQNRVIGVKNITGNDALLSGFRSEVRFPGYLTVEASAQTACVEALSKPENRGKIGIFLGIDTAQFHRGILPGEQLLIEVRSDYTGNCGMASAKCWGNGTLAAECEMKFVIAEKNSNGQ